MWRIVQNLIIIKVKKKKSYKDVEELEDAFVSENVEDISWYRVYDRQPVYLILQ